MNIMKKYRIYIAVTVIFLTIWMVNFSFENNGNTLEKRGLIVSSKVENAKIVSEAILGDSIISQIQSGDRNGFVVFERKNQGYEYKSYVLTSAEVLKHLIFVEDQLYLVFVFNKPQMHSVKILFYVTDSTRVIEEKNVELDSSTMYITELPDMKEVSVEVIFFDTKGNILENE